MDPHRKDQLIIQITKVDPKPDFTGCFTFPDDDEE